MSPRFLIVITAVALPIMMVPAQAVETCTDLQGKPTHCNTTVKSSKSPNESERGQTTPTGGVTKAGKGAATSGGGTGAPANAVKLNSSRSN